MLRTACRKILRPRVDTVPIMEMTMSCSLFGKWRRQGEFVRCLLPGEASSQSVGRLGGEGGWATLEGRHTALWVLHDKERFLLRHSSPCG